MTDNIFETQVTVRFQAFPIPYTVTDVAGAEQARAPWESASPPPPSPRDYQLREIPAEVLGQMCDDFRARLFEKSGHQDPEKDAHPVAPCAPPPPSAPPMDPDIYRTAGAACDELNGISPNSFHVELRRQLIESGWTAPEKND